MPTQQIRAVTIYSMKGNIIFQADAKKGITIVPFQKTNDGQESTWYRALKGDEPLYEISHKYVSHIEYFVSINNKEKS